MPNASAYLVLRLDDGFGDLYPLAGAAPYTLGRASSNRIVLKDDLCSREHAEVYSSEKQWYVRDLGSLNGTRVNGEPVLSDHPLSPNDEVQLGHSRLLFIADLAQLPNLPVRPTPADGPLKIQKRLGQTRFLSPESPTVVQPKSAESHREQTLALLYRLALDMGGAGNLNDLVGIVLDGLLSALPAEVGAVLAVKEGRELELLAYRHRNPNARTYHKVSQFVSNEVLTSREAVLATNVARDLALRNRDSLAELQVASLICAPVLFDGTCLGLIHLYCTGAQQALDAEALEFALAIARQLGTAMHQLQRQESLSAENQALRDQLRLDSEMVGASAPLRHIQQQIARVAETGATVLIRGESGAGKELVARAVHRNSPRKDGPFICLNCAALTETLLESELFGHEKGAFTGATERMAGKFESANHGTIFLDEIGEMAPGTQAKFLRLLEGHSFERVGGNTPIHVDVRVVAATNRPLELAVKEGKFRRDLFYRLNVVDIWVPPLRERPADVPVLAEHFLKRFVRETGRKIKGFTPAALAKLHAHHWPGNVRELRNVIERAVALGNGPVLDAADIWISSIDLDAPEVVSGAYEPLSLSELEKRHIEETLRHTEWNKSQTASILGIERSTLDRKIKGYDIKRE